ncbi:dienelactone hydrolase family protein [Streptomyces polyrhachis]|uniref:Dienelactone hydrolase family protein n=1 Tax=Streptomyces polyrhachis TaxID=1282885 RepID=A0ABW2GAB4_9ACTN
MAASPTDPLTVVLFHSAYGLRPAVEALADELRAAGHEVVVPDLYEDRTAGTVEEAMAIREEIGSDELLKRAVLAAAPHSDKGVVYAGLSLGGSIAQNLALADEKARGLLLFGGTSDLADDTVSAVEELPVQLHVADPDPFETHDWLTAWYLRMQRADTDPEVFRYPGAGHLFLDTELPDYDAEAAEAATARALAFLAELDTAAARG